MAVFKGCGVAIITPFTEDGKVDFDSFGKMIDWQIEEGIDSIVVCGTTGEASTLADEEHVATVKFCVERTAGRVPVIAGAGSNDTAHAVEMMKNLEAVGVDALLLVTPYYNKCSQKGLIQHYTVLADSVNIPCILYSVKGRTGVNINPETVAVLAKHPNIVGIKEASGDIAQVADICLATKDEDFDVYSGNDDSVIPLMSVGGIGYISVIANVAPKKSSEMAWAFLNGDFAKARDMQLEMLPLVHSLFADVNPIPVKAACAMMDICKMEYRLPLCAPNDNVLALIEKEMKGYGLL